MNNKKDLIMLIGAHQSFKPYVKDKDRYKVVYGNHDEIECDGFDAYKCTKDGSNVLDDKFYSEVYMMINLPNELKGHKYIGCCHYRRYFSFLDGNVIDDDLDAYDVIIPRPLVFNTTVREHYAIYHNIEDLEIIEGIIKKDFAEYSEMLDLVLNGNVFIPYNMFVMKMSDFHIYTDFLNKVLDKFLEVVGTDITKRIEDNMEKYIKNFYPNNTVEYQYRIGGYLAERLTNVFILKHFNGKKMKMYDVKITEPKYIKQ